MKRCDHDLVEREVAAHDGMCPICLADEVERLRDYSAGLEDVLRRSSTSDEIEPLLATLKAIERHTAPSTRTWDTCLRDMGLANDLARAALEPKP